MDEKTRIEPNEITEAIVDKELNESQFQRGGQQSVCPVCGGSTFEIRGKLHCSRCHTLCETCCEGGPQ